MSARLVLLALATFTAVPAVAAPPASSPDLVTAITVPAGTWVYDTGRYTVRVSNTGNKTAAGVEVTIALPETHTSPQVYILGTLGAYDGRCTLVSRTLECNLGELRKGASATVFFDIALPQSSQPILFDADATTTTNEANTGNNGDTEAASLAYDAITVVSGDEAHNEHCTGTGLTAFYECTLFPSSISSHDIVFGDFGSLTIPEAPDYTGSWSQPATNRLTFSYFDENGDHVMTFEGQGVSADCFEGLTNFFPPSPYVAPYSVCLQ